MQVQIYVGERGRWVVVRYPHETAENSGTLEALREEEDEGYPMQSLQPGFYTCNVVWEDVDTIDGATVMLEPVTRA